MIIDLASFAFGCNLIEGTGTPPWGTALGQQKPDYVFTHEGFEELLVGMVYNAVPLKQVCLPIGRGGNIVSGQEDTNIQLASVFRNVTFAYRCTDIHSDKRLIPIARHSKM